MVVLVIGSKGFIGSAVVRYLENAGYVVYGADIVQEYGGRNYFQIDPNASDYEYEEVFSAEQYDACINCSGAAVVRASFDFPLHDYQLNTVNVYRMVNSLRLHNPQCKFLTLSSAAVYGNPQSLPVTEDQELNPLSPYGFHKLQAEGICEHFSKLYGINSTIIRIFSAYGPGLRKQLFWDLNYKARNNPAEVKLFGTGHETRDFIYIDDLCEFVSKVISSDLDGFRILNAASGEQTIIKDAVEIFYKHIGFKGHVSFERESLQGYPTRWVADISRAKQIGFEPKMDLETGLYKYVKWLESI